MPTKAKQLAEAEETDTMPESPGIETGNSSQVDSHSTQIHKAAENPERVGRAITGLSSDNRAASMINKGVNMAVGILVVGLLTAYLLPIAINELVGVDTSSWGNAEAELFGLLPLFFVLAIVLFVVGKAMSAKSNSGS